MTEPIKLAFTAEDLATPTISRIKGELGGLQGAIGDFAGTTGMLSALMGGTFLAATARMVGGSIEFGAALHDMSQQTGLAVETLAYLKPAAEMSGTSLEAAAKGAQKLSKAMLDAATGNKEASSVFQALGVSVADSTGALRSSESVLNEVAKSITSLQSPTERVAAAQLLLGKSGAELIPLLAELSEGQRDLGKWTTEASKRADELDDAFTKMRIALQGTVDDVAISALPVIARLADVFQGAAVAAGQFGRSAAVVFKDIETLGRVVDLSSFGGMINLPKLFFKRDEIAQVLRERSAFVDAANADFEKQVEKYESVYDRVMNPKVTPKVDSGTSYAQRLSANEAAAREAREKEAAFKRAAAAAEAELNRLGAAMADLDRKSNAIDWGMSPETLKSIEDLDAAYAKLGFSADVYNERLAGIIDRDSVMTQQQEKKTAALKAEQEAVDKYWVSLQDKIDRERDAADAENNSAAAIAYKTLARMEDARALAQTLALSPEYFQTLDAEIAKQRELAEVLGSKEASAANKKAAEESLNEWNRITDNVSQSLADAIMGGGKSGGELLKQYFKTLVLTPTISALMSPVSNAMGSALGYNTGSAAAAANGALNLSGISLSSLLGVGSGVQIGSVGTGLYGSFATSGLGQALGLSSTSLGAAPGVAGMTGLGSSIAAALPWVAGALALASAFGLFDHKGGPKVEGSGMAGLTDAGLAQALTGWTGPTAHGGRLEMTGAADAAMQSVAMTFAQSAGAYLKNLGATTSGFAFGLGSSVDPQGTAGDWVNAAVSLNGRSIYASEYEAARDGGQAALQLETQRMLVAAVKASDVSSVYREIVANIDPATASAEQLAAALGQLTQTQQIVALMGERYSASLAEQAGGIANLQALVENYNNVAFTAEEKHARTLEALQGTFSSLNMTMPDTLAGFRSLVDAQDTTTEAGRATYVTLLGVSSAFAEITNSSDQAAQAVTQVSETIRALGYVSGDDMAAKVLSDFEGLAEALAGGDIGKQMMLTVDYITGQMDSIGQKRLAAARSGDSAAVQEYDRELTVLAAERKRRVEDLTDYTLFEASYKGRGAQLVELQNWYDEQKKLLVGNNQALLALEQAFGEKRKAIIEGSVGDALTGLRQNIGDWTQGLLTKENVSPLSMQRQMEIARQDYIDTLTGARAGDQTALSHFTTAAESYRSVAERMLGHTGDYVSIFNDIVAAGGELSRRNLMVATQAATSADIGGVKSAVASMESAIARLLEIGNLAEASSTAAIVAKLEALIAKLTPAASAAPRV